MTPEKTALLEQLLRSASSAHGEYEEKVLNGVYDEDWSRWYAGWVVEHGLNELVAQSLGVERWSQILSELNEQYKQTDQQQSWAAFTAQELTRMFK